MPGQVKSMKAAPAAAPGHGTGSIWPCILTVLSIWALAVWLVDPVGEFMTNDDPSFVQCLRALIHQGRLIETGWPTGGPSLIVHLLAAWPFVSLLGDTVTAMRLSVLAWGVLGSLGLLFLLRGLGLPRWQCLTGALALTLNPLYFSLSFSFMTEVSFAALLVLSLAALFAAWRRRSQPWLIAGLLLSLAATLIRQFGLVIPLALMASVLVLKGPLPFGRARLALLTLCLVAAPWLAWEVVLHFTAGTTVLSHRLAGNIWGQFAAKPLADYLSYMAFRLFVVIALYCSVFTAPFWLWRAGAYWRLPRVRKGLAVFAALFTLWEAAILTGLVSPPVAFYRNVIIDFGLGPLLFKDTYILGMPALSSLHPALYYGLVFLGVPGATLMLLSSLGLIRRMLRPGDAAPPPWPAVVSWLAAAIYTCVILFTGFHDRYFIPLVILVIIWLAADEPGPLDARPAPRAFKVAALACLLGLGAFSLTATHDFVATRKAALAAQQFLVTRLKVDPCHFDGGYEFNGYHCRQRVPKSGPGLSWWWVEREDYLLTLRKLPGYAETATFPVKRWLGRDGAVHVLRKE